MGPGEWWEDEPAPTVVNESFSGVEVDITTSIDHALGTFKVIGMRRGSIMGRGEYSEHDMTGWSPLGGQLAVEKSDGYAEGKEYGVNFEAITGSINFSYSTVNSVTFGHNGIPGFRVAMKGLKQLITTYITGTTYKKKEIYATAIGLVEGEWSDCSESFSESNTGSGVPVKLLGKKFP